MLLRFFLVAVLWRGLSRLWAPSGSVFALVEFDWAIFGLLFSWTAKWLNNLAVLSWPALFVR